MKPTPTNFNYPSEHPEYNVSIEFYDPNHRFEHKKNIRNSYDFNVKRFLYPVRNLTKEDLDVIIINAMYFIENPSEKYEDPFKDNPAKRATVWYGRAYKANVPFPLPRKSVYDGPMNYWEVVHSDGWKAESSESRYYEYMFVSFDSQVNVREAATEFINNESDKRRLYESIMSQISAIVKKNLLMND